jgi:hypothetical protein
MMKKTLFTLALFLPLVASSQQPTKEVLRKFVEDVVIDAKGPVERWASPGAVTVYNETSIPEAEAACTKIIESINEALAPVPFHFPLMAPRFADAPFRIVIVERKDFIAGLKKHGVTPLGTRTWGWWKWRNQSNEVIRSLVILSVEQGSLELFTEQAHIAIMGSLGFSGYSQAPVDSVLGPYRDQPRQTLTETDRQVLPFFFQHIQPGFKAYEVRRAFDRNWK